MRFLGRMFTFGAQPSFLGGYIIRVQDFFKSSGRSLFTGRQG
jgi:hypothetical protein